MSTENLKVSQVNSRRVIYGEELYECISFPVALVRRIYV